MGLQGGATPSQPDPVQLLVPLTVLPRKYIIMLIYSRLILLLLKTDKVVCHLAYDYLVNLFFPSHQQSTTYNFKYGDSEPAINHLPPLDCYGLLSIRRL